MPHMQYEGMRVRRKDRMPRITITTTKSINALAGNLLEGLER